MLNTTKQFELGNTIYFECIYRNIYSVYTDPTDPTWEIIDGKGTVIANSSSEGGPYKRSAGLWYIFWASTDIGSYVLTFMGTIGGNAVRIRRPFKVTKTAALY